MVSKKLLYVLYGTYGSFHFPFCKTARSRAKKTDINKFTGNVTLTASECDSLKSYAENSFLYKAENQRLREKLTAAQQSAAHWKKKFEELKEKAQPYLDALEIASEKVRTFIAAVLARGKEKQEQKHPARRHGRDMEL